jgi:hypothetical protein
MTDRADYDAVQVLNRCRELLLDDTAMSSADWIIGLGIIHNTIKHLMCYSAGPPAWLDKWQAELPRDPQ